jgi:hypothetical protein
VAGPRGIEPLTPGLKARCFRRKLLCLAKLRTLFHPFGIWDKIKAFYSPLENRRGIKKISEKEKVKGRQVCYS